MCAYRHIIHSLQEAGLKKWVALQEGAGYTMGWLTVHTLSTVRTSIHTLTTVRAWQTNERKESMCFQLRDAMRVGNICFSDEFFSTTSTIREVKQVLEDELVRARPPPSVLTCYSRCLPVRSATFASWWRYVHSPATPPNCTHSPTFLARAAAQDTLRQGQEDLLGKGRGAQRRSGMLKRSSLRSMPN